MAASSTPFVLEKRFELGPELSGLPLPNQAALSNRVWQVVLPFQGASQSFYRSARLDGRRGRHCEITPIGAIRMQTLACFQICANLKPPAMLAIVMRSALIQKTVAFICALIAFGWLGTTPVVFGTGSAMKDVAGSRSCAAAHLSATELCPLRIA